MKGWWPKIDNLIETNAPKQDIAESLLGENCILDKGMIYEFGYDGALVLNYIGYWMLFNEKKQKNFKDGHYWVYASVADLLKEFPFTSTSKLRGAIKKLYDAGMVIIGCFNKSGSDKTKWYRFNENNSLGNKYLQLIRERMEHRSRKVSSYRKKNSLCENSKSVSEINKSVCENHKPLPTVITDVKTDVAAPSPAIRRKPRHRRLSYNAVDFVEKENNSYAC